MPATRRTTITCFGEALWDILPRGLFPGGAPLNVAYHLSRHGVDAWPISAVGRDFLGDEIRHRIKNWGLETRFIARVADRATGTVRASLDTKGVASYHIARGVAWDAIAVPAKLLRAPAPSALVYGTLALREKSNRNALDQLVNAWPTTLRVLDLNLRAPFETAAALTTALRHAQLLKLNESELSRLDGRELKSIAAVESAARRLAERRNLARICVTVGARGAGLLWDGRWYWEPSRPVAIRDTVGAGDAFLGAFLASLLLRGARPPDALAAACRIAEFVVSRDGATPPYRVDRNGRPMDDVAGKRRR